MKKLIVAAAVALGCVTGAAQAAPVITYTPGGSATPAGQTLIQSFDSYLAGTFLGNGTYVFSQSVPNFADRPAGTTNNFAAVTAGGRYDQSFSTGASAFSFVFGTLDAYNSLIVHFATGPDLTLSGADIIGNQGSLQSSGLVNYGVGTGPLFTGISFLSTTNNSFEIDTISAAVPEPAAWGMMILGLGLIGGVLRRRPSMKVRFA